MIKNIRLVGTEYTCTYDVDASGKVHITQLETDGKVLPLSICMPQVLTLLMEKLSGSK